MARFLFGVVSLASFSDFCTFLTNKKDFCLKRFSSLFEICKKLFYNILSMPQDLVQSLYLFLYEMQKGCTEISLFTVGCGIMHQVSIQLRIELEAHMGEQRLIRRKHIPGAGMHQVHFFFSGEGLSLDHGRSVFESLCLHPTPFCRS